MASTTTTALPRPTQVGTPGQTRRNPAAAAAGTGPGGSGGGSGGGGAGGGGGNPPPPPPANVPANVPFALSPAQAVATAYIDYSSRTGMMLFNQATAPLSIEFDVEEGGVQTFIDLLRDRADMAGWSHGQDPITMVNGVDLLAQFGTILSFL